MGSKSKNVRRASQSSYEITFFYQGKRCRERVKAKPSNANDRVVTRFLASIEQAIIDGYFNYAESFKNSKHAQEYKKKKRVSRVDHYLINWFDDKKNNFKASTVKAYGKIINNFLIPAIGHLDLADLKRYDVKQMIKSWTVQKKMSNTRISILRRALADAVDDELIENNILYGWNFVARKDELEKHDPINPFNKDEIKTLLSGLIDEERNIFQTLMFTGMRPSEIVCLTWSDINFKNKYISINKSQTDAAHEPEETKTETSKRRIKILSPALEVLKNQRLITGMKNNLVFENPRTHKKWKTKKLYDVLKRRLKNCELPHRKLEQTRHTYACLLYTSPSPRD